MTQFSQPLLSEWRDAGIENGDILLVHSALGRLLRNGFGGEKLNPAIILDTLLAAVGEAGTLLLPLFNFDFCKGVAFDVRTTSSHMGVLTEAGRLHPGAIRTGHPVYSFAVIGKRSAEFQNVMNESAYGADSPFAILHQMNGKIGVIDLPDQNSMTFYHYVEESLRVPYRYDKNFTADYTDANGKCSEKTFKIYVRDIENGVLTDVGGMEKKLWEQNLFQGKPKGEDGGLRVIQAAPLYEAVATVIRAGNAEGMLFSREKKAEHVA